MKLFKDERGLGHVIEIIIVAVIVVGVGGFIWWRMASTQQSATGDQTSQQATSDLKCDYNDDNLCKFITGYKLATDYKVESTLTSGDSVVNLTLESTDSGKNTHNIMKSSSSGYETIVIGETEYVKDPIDGQWWKRSEPVVATDTTQSQPSFSDPNGTNAAGVKVEYKSLGTEACASLTCYKYQIVDPSVPDQIQYIWFDNKDYMLRRMTTSFDGSNNDFVFTYEGISITAPATLKAEP